MRERVEKTVSSTIEMEKERLIFSRHVLTRERETKNFKGIS
jgi:hypothetical protein